MAIDTAPADSRGHSGRLTQPDRSSRDAALALPPLVSLIAIILGSLGLSAAIGWAVRLLASARLY